MEGRDPECPIELGGRTREIITARSPAAPQPRAAFCLSRLWLPSCGRQGPSSPPRAFCPREAFRAVWGGEVCRTVSSSALCTINAPLSEHQHRRGEMRWEQGSSVLINIEETKPSSLIQLLECVGKHTEITPASGGGGTTAEPPPSPRPSFLGRWWLTYPVILWVCGCE